MHRVAVGVLVLAGFCLSLSAHPRGQAGSDGGKTSAVRRPIIYVMPNELASNNSEVVVSSSHNGKEPQVAKIYQELQRRKECQGFSENMMREKADYLLLLQHGGGKGNRWALSDKEGNVIASGDSMLLGSSVKDACLAIAKDWQQHDVK
jgi:hypothetical protein